MHIITPMNEQTDSKKCTQTINVDVQQASGVKFERNERYFIMGNNKEKHQGQFALDIVNSLNSEKRFSMCYVVANCINDATRHVLSNLNNVTIHETVYPSHYNTVAFQNDSVIIMIDVADTELFRNYVANPLYRNTTLILIQSSCRDYTLLRQFRYIALDNHVGIEFLRNAYKHVLGMFETFDILCKIFKEITKNKNGLNKYFMFVDISGKSTSMNDVVKCYYTNVNSNKTLLLNDSCTESDDESICSSSTQSSENESVVAKLRYKQNKKQQNINVKQASGREFKRDGHYLITGKTFEKHGEQLVVDIVKSSHKNKPFNGGCFIVTNRMDDVFYTISQLQWTVTIKMHPLDSEICFPDDCVVIMSNIDDAKILQKYFTTLQNRNITLIVIQTHIIAPKITRQFRYIMFSVHCDEEFLKKMYAHYAGYFPTFDSFYTLLCKIACSKPRTEIFMSIDTKNTSQFVNDKHTFYWTDANDGSQTKPQPTINNSQKTPNRCVDTSESDSDMSDDKSTYSSRTYSSIESITRKTIKAKSVTQNISPISFDNFQLEQHPKPPSVGLLRLPPSFLVSAPTRSPNTWTLVANILAKLQETSNFKTFYICTNNDNNDHLTNRFAGCFGFGGVIAPNVVPKILVDIEKRMNDGEILSEMGVAIVFVNMLDGNNEETVEVLYNGRHYGISSIFVEDFPICTNVKLANIDYLLFNIFSSAKLLANMSNAHNEKIIDNLVKMDDSHVFAVCRNSGRACNIRVNYVKTNTDYVPKQQIAENVEIRNLKKSIEKYKKELAKKKFLLGEMDSDSEL